MLAHQIPVILGGGFDPSVIFTEMQGAWLEPRIGNMWQESIGLTPTTSSGQTAGLLLDLSKQASIGADIVANGDFSSDTWWTVVAGCTIESGVARLASAANGLRLYRNPLLDSGSTYEIKLSISNWVAGAIQLFNAITVLNPAANGAYTFRFVANSTYLGFQIGGGPATFDIDNVSCRQIFGNHASQATAANRPTLQYVNGRPLLRCDSNDFMTVSLPNLGSGVFSSSGSVYLALPTGMSSLHNQSIGTSYSAPIQSMDLYGVVIVPSRLSDQREAQLQTYFEKLAGLR